MDIWYGLGIGLVILFLLWRWNIRRSGQWIDIPEDPHTFVSEEFIACVDWLAKEAEKQIPGFDVSNNALLMSTLNQAVEDALMDKAEDGSICIDIPVLIGDAEGSYGVSTTISAEQLKEFGIDDWWEE